MDSLETIVQKVITRLSMVNGVSVQTYAADRIAQYVQDAFDEIFDSEWWEQFRGNITLSLDGVSGTHTSDISTLVKSYKDIKHIYLSGSNTKLNVLPDTVNPKTLTGTTAMYYDGHIAPEKVFTIYPITATSDIDVIYRTKPDNFLPDDIVNMDSMVLVLAAAYDYAVDDNTNDAQAQKLYNKYMIRLTQLKNIRNSNISLTPNNVTSINGWTMS